MAPQYFLCTTYIHNKYVYNKGLLSSILWQLCSVQTTPDDGRWTMDAGPSTPYYKLTGELKKQELVLLKRHFKIYHPPSEMPIVHKSNPQGRLAEFVTSINQNNIENCFNMLKEWILSV